MKHLMILICALIAAFLLVEMITVFIIGYPNLVPGKRKYIIHKSLDAYNHLGWQPPYYKFWNVEGGNKCYHLNNFGLPGSDIGKNPQNIIILGSSFIEGMQVPNTKMATAVFAELLAPMHKYNIINLGASGHDPYISWFRLNFFKRWFRPDYVILVIDPTSMAYFNRRWDNNLNFSSPFIEPELIPEAQWKKLLNLPRAYSAFINLAINLLMSNEAPTENIPSTDKTSAKQSSFEDTDIFYHKIDQCITQYNQAYMDKFMVVSMIDEKKINDNLDMLCHNRHCYFASDDSILVDANKIKNGHLNLRGNRLFGIFMYNQFKSRY